MRLLGTLDAIGQFVAIVGLTREELREECARALDAEHEAGREFGALAGEGTRPTFNLAAAIT